MAAVARKGREALEREVALAEANGNPAAGLLRALLDGVRDPVSPDDIDRIVRTAVGATRMHVGELVRSEFRRWLPLLGATGVVVLLVGIGLGWAVFSGQRAFVSSGPIACNVQDGRQVCTITVYDLPVGR